MSYMDQKGGGRSSDPNAGRSSGPAATAGMSDFARDAYEQAHAGNTGLEDIGVPADNTQQYRPSANHTGYDDGYGDNPQYGNQRMPKSSGASDSWRRLAAQMKGDTWKLTVVKATSKEQIGPPKSKHVLAIMDGLDRGGSALNRRSDAGSIFYQLRKRLTEPEWIVVVKTLIIFHRVLREGNESFTNYFVSKASSVVDLRNWNGQQCVAFVRTYSGYLYEWCAMKRRINFPPGKAFADASLAQNYYASDVKKVVKEIPVLMNTLEALMRVEVQSEIQYSTAGKPAFIMLIRDVTYIWVGITQGILTMVDAFFESPVNQAKSIYEIYKRHLSLLPRARKCFDILKTLGTDKPLPEVMEISADLEKTMKEYIDDKMNPKVEEDVQYSDEEAPEQYYEPQEDYFSESDPEPEYYSPPRPPPMPRRRTPTPPSSSSESEESSSEEEPEPEPVPVPLPEPVVMPAPIVQPKAFDPLVDLLGMQQMTVSGQQMTTYQQPVYQQPGFQQTGDARVQSIKAVMSGVQQQRVMSAQGMPGQLVTLPASTAVPQQGGIGGGAGGGLSNVYAQMQAAQMQRTQGVPPQQMQQNTQMQQNMHPQLMNVAYMSRANPQMAPAVQAAPAQMYQTFAGPNGMQMVPVQMQQVTQRPGQPMQQPTNMYQQQPPY